MHPRNSSKGDTTMFDSLKPTESLTPDDRNLVFDWAGGDGQCKQLLNYI